MRSLTLLTILVGIAFLGGCGGGDDSQVITVHELELTADQAAQIKSQDQLVFEEEGGPQKVIQPTRKKR